MIPSVPRCTCDHNCAIISSNLHKIQGKVFSTSMNYVWKPIALEMQAFNSSNEPFKAILKKIIPPLSISLSPIFLDYNLFLCFVPTLVIVWHTLTMNVSDWTLDSTDIVQNCAGSLFLLLGWRKLDMCLSQNLLISMFLNMLVAHWFYRMSSFSINRTWCVVIWKKRCEETVRKYYNHH